MSESVSAQRMMPKVGLSPSVRFKASDPAAAMKFVDFALSYSVELEP